MKKMSQKAYVDSEGVKCPFCGSENLDREGVDVDAGGASQRVSCDDCGKTWYDCYKLTGYIELFWYGIYNQTEDL